jgi:predicted membrane-bound mannosyltransferase
MIRTRAGSPENRWGLRDAAAAAVLFLATAGVILWQNAHVAVLFDLSYILNTAERIALGQMPYRDFPLAHAPLTFLMQAAIIRLTGRVFFHHVLYVALTGGLGTVLAWRIALHTLRGRVPSAWTIALLLAAPLIVLGIYCIVPNPEYDCDCGLSILAAIWLL